MSQVSWSWMRSYPLSKSVCQVRSNYWYEKCQTTHGSEKVCNYILDHCNGHRPCEMQTSNETVINPVTSTCLSVVYPTQNWQYVEQVFTYRISWEIYTPYAGDSGMLLHISWQWQNWNHHVSHTIELLVFHQHLCLIKHPSMKQK
jgi:hypothetical protein